MSIFWSVQTIYVMVHLKNFMGDLDIISISILSVNYFKTSEKFHKNGTNSQTARKKQPINLHAHPSKISSIQKKLLFFQFTRYFTKSAGSRFVYPILVYTVYSHLIFSNFLISITDWWFSILNSKLFPSLLFCYQSHLIKLISLTTLNLLI